MYVRTASRARPGYCSPSTESGSSLRSAVGSGFAGCESEGNSVFEIGEAPDEKSGLVGSLESSGCVGFSVVGSVTVAVRSSSVGYAVVFRVIREYLTVEPERFLEQQAQQTRQRTTTIMIMRPPTVVPTAILTTLLEVVL